MVTDTKIDVGDLLTDIVRTSTCDKVLEIPDELFLIAAVSPLLLTPLFAFLLAQHDPKSGSWPRNFATGAIAAFLPAFVLATGGCTTDFDAISSMFVMAVIMVGWGTFAAPIVGKIIESRQKSDTGE